MAAAPTKMSLDQLLKRCRMQYLGSATMMGCLLEPTTWFVASLRCMGYPSEAINATPSLPPPPLHSAAFRLRVC